MTTLAQKLVVSSGGIVVMKKDNRWEVALLYKNGFWVLPKGRIERGENEQQAALREIQEELGLPLSKLRVVKKLGYMRYIAAQPEDNFLPRPKIVSVFLVESLQSDINPLRRDGFVKAEWFSLEESFRIVTLADVRVLLFRASRVLEASGERRERIKIVGVALGEGNNRRPSGSIPRQRFLTELLSVLSRFELGFEGVYFIASSRSIERLLCTHPSFNPTKMKVILPGIAKVPQAISVLRNLADGPFVYLERGFIPSLRLLQRLIRRHLRSKALITLGVSPRRTSTSRLLFDVRAGRVRRVFRISSEKGEKNLGAYVGTGMFVIDHRIFDLAPDLVYCPDTDSILEILVKSGMGYPVLPFVNS